MTAAFSSDSFTPGDIVASNSHDLIVQQITLVAGQNLTRGAVLGKITASEKYTLSASAAGDGSEVPDLVLVNDTDASAGDKEALGYARGDFIEGGLTFGAGHTADSVREGLRIKGIFLISSVGA